MFVTFEKAQETYNRFERKKRVPTLHPRYLQIDSKRDPSLVPVYFVYEEGQNYFYHGLHKSLVPGTDFFDLQSPYGYGGPLSSAENSDFLKRAQSEYGNLCTKEKILAEFIRFHPEIENWHYYEGDIVPNRPTVTVDVTAADLLATYVTRARTAVKKAAKSGLEIIWTKNDIYQNDFKKLYSESMLEKEANPFYSFGENYFSSLLAWEQTSLATCTLDEEVVASALFLVEGEHMEYFLSASSSKGKKLGAMNLLLHEAFLRGKSMGCKSAHLGGGVDRDPKNPLLFFKEGFSLIRREFKIGKRVFDNSIYTELKKSWPSPSDSVLFYR